MDIFEAIASYFKPKKQKREWYLHDNVVITVQPPHVQTPPK
ncbi:MAG: hypothetical protein RBT41_06915 [Clostridia bacterium]|nr:hypothetical protein [Clostridia bacterium]